MQRKRYELDEKIGVPLYKQLTSVFMELIEQKQWPIGCKIPSEMELCDQYNISRTTVRLALQALENKGLIYRKPGSGTTVVMPKMEHPLKSFYSFSDNLGEKQHALTSQVLGFHTIACSETVAENLEIESGSKVFQLERTRLVDGTPFAYENSYIPVSVCPLLSVEVIATSGLYRAIFDLTGKKPDKATESFSAVFVGKGAAKALDTTVKQPALQIERVTYAGKTIVEYCNSIVRGDSLKYKVVLN